MSIALISDVFHNYKIFIKKDSKCSLNTVQDTTFVLIDQKVPVKIKTITCNRRTGAWTLSEEKLKYLLVFLNDIGTFFFYFKSQVFLVLCNVSRPNLHMYLFPLYFKRKLSMILLKRYFGEWCNTYINTIYLIN